MTARKNRFKKTHAERIAALEYRIELLEGVQGPERHLVGQSRSAGRQGGVEEATPGRRAVGKIGGATELRRHLSRKIEEARDKWKSAETRGAKMDAYAWMAVNDALVQLRADFDRMAEKRSDLSHVQADAPR